MTQVVTLVSERVTDGLVSDSEQVHSESVFTPPRLLLRNSFVSR